MSSRLEMRGTADLTGQEFGTLIVTGMASRRPKTTWLVRCQETCCKASLTVEHSKLMQGVVKGCPNFRNHVTSAPRQSSATFLQRIPGNRSSVSDEARQFAAEEAEREAKQLQEQDQQAAAERVNQTDERESRRRENMAKMEREWVETGRDPQLYVTPELITVSMPSADADKFNKAEADKFARECPGWNQDYRSSENFQALGNYFRLNGVAIADAATIHAAFRRLVALGIITKRPAPKAEPVKVQSSRPVEKPRQVQYGDKTGKGTLGRDYTTGADRYFTDREVDRMSSTDFKRAFGTVFTVAELLTQMRNNRSANV